MFLCSSKKHLLKRRLPLVISHQEYIVKLMLVSEENPLPVAKFHCELGYFSGQEQFGTIEKLSHEGCLNISLLDNGSCFLSLFFCSSNFS